MKDEKKKITPEELVELVSYNLDSISKCDTIYKKYIAWNAITEDDLKLLEYIATIETKPESETIDPYSTMSEYWSEDGKISFAHYPYFGCQVYRYKNCDSLYFIYMELGGHAAEKRCRLIQKTLIAGE